MNGGVGRAALCCAEVAGSPPPPSIAAAVYSAAVAAREPQSFGCVYECLCDGTRFCSAASLG